MARTQIPEWRKVSENHYEMKNKEADIWIRKLGNQGYTVILTERNRSAKTIRDSPIGNDLFKSKEEAISKARKWMRTNRYI